MTLYDLWVKHKRPLSPFYLYSSPESSGNILVDTVIFHYPRLPVKSNEVSFFSTCSDERIESDQDFHSLYVAHEGRYQL